MFCIFELRAIESIWTSVNFAFLAHVELIKLCDAPESNNMSMWCAPYYARLLNWR
jgi:hypothetical protein